MCIYSFPSKTLFISCKRKRSLMLLDNQKFYFPELSKTNSNEKLLVQHITTVVLLWSRLANTTLGGALRTEASLQREVKRKWTEIKKNLVFSSSVTSKLLFIVACIIILLLGSKVHIQCSKNLSDPHYTSAGFLKLYIQTSLHRTYKPEIKFLKTFPPNTSFNEDRN